MADRRLLLRHLRPGDLRRSAQPVASYYSFRPRGRHLDHCHGGNFLRRRPEGQTEEGDHPRLRMRRLLRRSARFR